MKQKKLLISQKLKPLVVLTSSDSSNFLHLLQSIVDFIDDFEIYYRK